MTEPEVTDHATVRVVAAALIVHAELLCVNITTLQALGSI
jgi:hypothetical protein